MERGFAWGFGGKRNGGILEREREGGGEMEFVDGKGGFCNISEISELARSERRREKAREFEHEVTVVHAKYSLLVFQTYLDALGFYTGRREREGGGEGRGRERVQNLAD